MTRHAYRKRRYNQPTFTTHTHQLLDYIESQPILPFRLSKISKECLTKITQMIHHSSVHIPSYEVLDMSDKTMTEFMTSFENTNESRNMPKSISQNIHTNEKIGRIVSANIHGRKIKLYLILPKSSKHSRLFSSTRLADSFFDTCTRRIIVWLDVALQFSGKDCASSLDCYLFFTDDIKRLPKNTNNSDNKLSVDGYPSPDNLLTFPITQYNANTAFTYSCTSSAKIVLFRMEEWFKVFIHETFHCFGLDFSQMNNIESNKQMSKLFPKCHSHMDFRIYETYCEIWAETIHTVFIAYLEEITTSNRFGYNTKRTQKGGRTNVSHSSNGNFNETRMNHILKRVEYLIQRERMFSLFQMSKILHYHTLDYLDLCSTPHTTNQNTYTEKTQVFAYYIVKTILMFHLNEFIEWCNKNNKSSILFFKKTNTNIREYGNLIERLYMSPEFVKIVESKVNTIHTIVPISRVRELTINNTPSIKNHNKYNYSRKTSMNLGDNTGFRKIHVINEFIYDTLRMSLFEMETT